MATLLDKPFLTGGSSAGTRVCGVIPIGRSCLPPDGKPTVSGQSFRLLLPAFTYKRRARTEAESGVSGRGRSGAGLTGESRNDRRAGHTDEGNNGGYEWRRMIRIWR